ncbi:uncharacterized mitochondrial protein-like protein [Tanacetum coccineum]|uniref:Uncharacterized mitochondrial protein-like protein n=1 Tax=Tanacetum coccineum TaxID=301880 RepID=A0ABQ5A7J0_9ASTR
MIKPVWNNSQRANHQNFAKKTHPCAKKNLVPRVVLMKSGLVSINTARQVNAARSKTTVNAARPMSYLSKITQSTVKSPIHKNIKFKNSNFNQRVNTVRDKHFNTARLKAVVNAVKGNNFNVVKASACWVWKPKHKVLDHGNPQMDLQDKGVIDSGCSRHMTWNMFYLTDYEAIDGGYVAFGGNPKEGKITRKDDYSRFTWVFFLATKDETSGILKSFIIGIENLVDHKVKVIRCDNGTEFKNREMNQFFEMKGILRQFSLARIPQQNEVAERRNKTLIEAARTMLADSKLPTTFWAEAVNIACYVQNRVLVVKPHNKTPYEIFHGRTPTLSFMRPFGCPVTILNTIDHLGKFDGKADEGFFVGYSLNSKAFRVFNSRTRIVEENMHIRFSKSTPNAVGVPPPNYDMQRNTTFGVLLHNTCTRVYRSHDCKTLMETQKPLLKDEDGEEVDVHMYRYQVNPKVLHLHAVKRIFSDYARASLDRKFTAEACQFLRCKLISWQCKKQTVVANSTTEAEYVAASSCCGQVLWIQNQLLDYGYNFMHTKIFIDNNRKAKKSVKLMMEKLFRMELELMLFWSTVKAKTINGEVQLHAIVDGKKIIITESTVRRDLQLEDAEGVDCLPNSTIFEQLTLMGSKTTTWNEFSSTMASAIICLATNQKFNFSKYIFENEAVHKELGDSLVRAATTASSVEAECQEAMGDTITQTRFENVSKHSNDSLLARGNTLQSDEDRLKLDELMALCTTLQNRVLDLEKTKTTQANEIASLKRRVKKLEKKNRSRTHRLKRLYKVGLTARVESSGDEESLGEDASKQGRINAINADEEITLVSVQDDADKEMFDVDALNGEEVFVAGQNENVVKEVVDVAQVSTTATTVTITTEEITLAQALEALKTSKPKVKGIVFQEPGKSTTTTTISSQQSQDKGKGILIKPVEPMKKKDLIRLDEEVALKLQAEFDEEEILVREKAEKVEEANIALIETWDDIQAKIDADHQLAERLQA